LYLIFNQKFKKKIVYYTYTVFYDLDMNLSIGDNVLNFILSKTWTNVMFIKARKHIVLPCFYNVKYLLNTIEIIYIFSISLCIHYKS